MVRLLESRSAFGINFEEWRKAAQKAGRWFRREWRREQRRSYGNGMTRRIGNLQNHEKAATAPSTVGISKRSGGGRRGGRGEGGRRDGGTGGPQET